MGLRDKIKQRIKSKAASDPVAAAGRTSERAARGASRVRARAAELRARAEALDAGQNPQDEDDLRSQAARAEEVATMTSPVDARLDPIDIPNAFEGQQNQESRDQATMEDLVLGGGGSRDHNEDDRAVGLDFDDRDDRDDETDPFFGGI